MKKLKITKIIANILMVLSIFALNPIGVNAEWKHDSKGWWFAEGNSWLTGWSHIDGQWYYFDKNGYMLSDTTTPDGYHIDSDGIWTDTTPIGQSDFGFDATTGTIKRYKGSDAEVVIPSTINGVKVKIIGFEAFRWCKSITNVTIPDGVTTIERNAFYGCSYLKNITIPNSVTRIEDSAFSECSSLTSILIPNGVKFIGISEFEGCTSLESITIPISVTIIRTREISPGGPIINPFQDCTKATIYVKSNVTKELLINAGVNASKITVTK